MGAKGMWSLENQLLGKAIEFTESFEGLPGWQSPTILDVSKTSKQ